MDLLIEILLEVYGELMFLAVPEKATKKKYIIISKIFAIFVLTLVVALVIWGVYLIADRNNLLGIIPICAAVVISAAQIILGIVLFCKRNKDSKD